MFKLVNKAYPGNFIFVSDAYLNGDRIICNTGDDIFDLWASLWLISKIFD